MHVVDGVEQDVAVALVLHGRVVAVVVVVVVVQEGDITATTGTVGSVVPSLKGETNKRQ